MVVLAAAALPALPVAARVQLDAHIQDHMVVQRGKPWQVSGTAADGERVIASFLGQRRETHGSAGRWTLTFDVPAAMAGPADLAVGPEMRKVMVGELWLCSGQSNMALPVGRAADGEQIAHATLGRTIHVLHVAKPTTADQPWSGRWLRAEPATVGRFSAVCLAFGSALHDRVRAPVGLIDSSVGATMIESWISPEGMRTVELGAYARERYAKTRKQRAAGGKLRNVSGMEKPSDLFELMVRPQIRQPLQGVLWYQGEGNRRSAGDYAALLRLLIRDWREHWGDAGMAFVVIQLPGYGAPSEFDPASEWAAVREAQRSAIAASFRAGLVVTLQLGDGTIHPAAKLPFGARAAAVAAEVAYAAEAAGPAPSPVAARAEGGALRIELAGGRACLKPEQPARSIYVAGEDRRWHRAEVGIERSGIVARSPEVTRPVAARHAWSDNPPATLVACDGMPVTPFRTDDWPLP